MTGGKVAGLIAVVLAVALAAFDLLGYMAHHPKRGIAILVVGAILLVAGIILLVARGGASQPKS